MKEKLGIAMIVSVCLNAFILFLVLVFPQLFKDSVQTTDFAKGIASALVCCLVGLIVAFKYDKRSCSDKS